jgi:hypothetical protein
MTILSENAFAGPFVPNGTTTVFPFNFGAVSPSEVSVFRLNAAGAQIAESGYTVHLLDVGGNVVYGSAPPAGDPLYIVSNPNFEQQVNFLAQGNWSPKTMNGALDRAAVRDQMLLWLSNRSLRAPEPEPNVAQLPSIAGRRNKVLGFGSGGQPMVIDPSELGALQVPAGGGSNYAIGLFVDAATADISLIQNVVRTSGYSVEGIGGAEYIYDPAVDATYVSNNPLTSFIALDSRGFRLSMDQDLKITMAGAVSGGVIDCYPAFAALIALFGVGGGMIRVPRGKYRMSQTLVLTTGVWIIGDGRSRNPGIIGATNYAFPDFMTDTLLLFDTGVQGVLFLSNSDAATGAAGTADYKYAGATWARMAGLVIASQGGGTSGTHGILIRAITRLDDVYIRHFSGDGVRVEADAGSTNPVPYGNASNTALYHVESAGNGGDGFRFNGRDANACLLSACKATGNSGWGFNDTSLLGNTYVECENDINTAGSFRCPGLVTLSTYIGCYSEQAGSELSIACIVLGGQLAEVGLHPDSTPAFVLCGGGLSIGAPYQQRNAAGAKVINFATGETGATNTAFRWGNEADGFFKMVLDLATTDWWTLTNDASAKYIMEFPKGAALPRCFGPAFPEGLTLGRGGVGPRIFYGTAAPFDSSIINRGDRWLMSTPSAGGKGDQICTTAGFAGSTAVFKAANPIDA